MSKKTVAQLFKETRLKKGFTQGTLAKKAGIYPNTYSKVEREEQEPQLSTIRAIAKVLDLDLAEVLKLLS